MNRFTSYIVVGLGLIVGLTACALVRPARMENVDSFTTYPDGRVSELMATDLVEWGTKLRLQIIYKKPEGRGPFPLLLFNHGSTRNNPDKNRVPLYFDTIADYFVRHGWMVAVPQRRGRGWSDGIYDEGYACNSVTAWQGIERALTDIGAALDVLVARPEVDGRHVVIGGHSRGGISSVVFAGQNPKRVQGVINFVGGWVSENCSDINAIHRLLFREGAAFPKPMLWIYSPQDPLYSTAHSQSNFDHFSEKGGKGTFIVTGLGHASWQHLSSWRRHVATYMHRLGYHEFPAPDG